MCPFPGVNNRLIEVGDKLKEHSLLVLRMASGVNLGSSIGEDRPSMFSELS